MPTSFDRLNPLRPVSPHPKTFAPSVLMWPAIDCPPRRSRNARPGSLLLGLTEVGIPLQQSVHVRSRGALISRFVAGSWPNVTLLRSGAVQIPDDIDASFVAGLGRYPRLGVVPRRTV